eukprot:728802-Lingulodinium_polyedra.AAC.1
MSQRIRQRADQRRGHAGGRGPRGTPPGKASARVPLSKGAGHWTLRPCSAWRSRGTVCRRV